MRVDVVSIFPDYLAGPLRVSLLGRAVERGLLDVRLHDLRRWTSDRHRTVDDTPYGGGAGMVMRPEPWGLALDTLFPPDDPGQPGAPAGAGGPVEASPPVEVGGPVEASPPVEVGGPAEASPPVEVGGPVEAGGARGPSGAVPRLVVPRLVVPTPAGRPFTQALAAELAAEPWLVFACGRYEGIDQRVTEHAATRMPVEEVSLGDYVLAGGEAAVLVVIEAVARLLPGFLGNPESLTEESHAGGLLEYPVYTRPPVWRSVAVPDVLLSGDHGAVARWRRDVALRRTAARRPDLLAAADLTPRDRQALDPT